MELAHCGDSTRCRLFLRRGRGWVFLDDLITRACGCRRSGLWERGGGARTSRRRSSLRLMGSYCSGLLAWLVQMGQTMDITRPTYLINRVALALAAVTIRCVPRVWPTALNDLLEMCARQPPLLRFVLEVRPVDYGSLNGFFVFGCSPLFALFFFFFFCLIAPRCWLRCRTSTKP